MADLRIRTYQLMLEKSETDIEGDPSMQNASAQNAHRCICSSYPAQLKTKFKHANPMVPVFRPTSVPTIPASRRISSVSHLCSLHRDHRAKLTQYRQQRHQQELAHAQQPQSPASNQALSSRPCRRTSGSRWVGTCVYTWRFQQATRIYGQLLKMHHLRGKTVLKTETSQNYRKNTLRNTCSSVFEDKKQESLINDAKRGNIILEGLFKDVWLFLDLQLEES
ncbi:hypothetical protein KCU90_g78, partial [Aureobasidium melanogenum]